MKKGLKFAYRIICTIYIVCSENGFPSETIRALISSPVSPAARLRCVGMMTGPALLPCLHCASTQCQGRASSCFDSPSPSLHRLMAIVYESSGDQWRGWPQMWSHDNGHVFQDILQWVAAPLRAPETVSPSQLFGKLDLFTCSKLPFKQLHRLCCTSNNLI